MFSTEFISGFKLFSKKFVHVNNRERSGSVLDSRPKGREFEPHRRHCVVSLSKTHLS